MDDMPKIVREWRKPKSDRGSWLFAIACGLIGVVILLGGCAMQVSLGKVDAGLQVDPGKLAPLIRR